MTWKLYALLSGGGLVATYLMSGPVTTPPVRQQPRAAVKSEWQGISATEMQALADHLEQSRIHNEVRYHEPTRNPFAFGQTPRPESRQVIAPKPIETPAPVVVAPPPPPVTLSGIAADRANGEWTRTAIFSSSKGVTLAHEGEMIGGGYRVVSIAESAVTLESSEGSKTTLSLTRP